MIDTQKKDRILELRKQGKSLAEISQIEGISRQRVWQIGRKLDGFEKRFVKPTLFKICANTKCGQSFLVKNPKARYCSRKCAGSRFVLPEAERIKRDEAYKAKKRIYANKYYYEVVKPRNAQAHIS